MSKKILAATLLCAATSFQALAQYHAIHNVQGYTLTQDNKLEQFQTLIVKDGKVVSYGDANLLTRYPNATKTDGEGNTLLPGLIDAHGHILGLGKNLSQLDLRNAHSRASIGQALSEYAKNTKGWIIGRGWNQELWPNKTFPTAHDLDKYVSDRPVVLTRVDGHAVWVNSKAMELAGITSETKAPEGGEIVRHNGQPTGIFVDKAENLIYQHMPATDKAQLAQQLEKAGEHLLSLGITSVHDAGINYDTYQLYREKAAQNKLPIRIYGMLSSTDEKLEQMYRAGKVQDKHDYLSIRSIKVYADGALGSRGAALIKDYEDREQHKGLMLETNDALKQIFQQAFKYGFSVNTHAIGDRANRIVLDTYQDVYKTTGGKLLRNRIEHAQIVEPSDIPRFKELNIIPSMQPVHATSDMHMAELRLGEQRLTGAYAWQTFLKQGSKVAAGSDFPVELANAFDGLYAAISRQDKKGLPENGWRAEEVLTREQALRAFTLDAAYAAHQEFKIGSLEKGKWADFILIDKNYFTVPVEQIHTIKVNQTWLAGEQKYTRPTN